MFLFRKIGKLLRGNLTAFQILSATVLGGIIGFSAPPDVAPGLYMVLFVLVLIFNCNLLLFALSAALGYILSLIFTPLSLSIGKFLLAGPISGLFALLINAPVAAWFGWEYYVFAGALPLAILYGIVLGMAIDRVLHSYRVKMANLEENSERFKKLIKNPLFKLTTFLFIGGFSGKKGFQETLEAGRKGLPIRISGAVAVITAIPLGWALLNMFDSTFYTARIREVLEQANEATVDLQSAEIDYTAGKLSLKGLALADPSELSRNRFSSAEITANISWAELLSKNVVIEEVTIASALINSERRIHGNDDIAQAEDTAEPAASSPESQDRIPLPGIPTDISAEDISKKYESAKQVLSTVKEWMKTRQEEKAASKADSTRKDEDSPSWQQRLEQQIAASGMRGAVAEHLLEENPRVTVNALTVRDLRITGTDLGILDVDAIWISDSPEFLENPPEITVKNRSEQIYAHVRADTLRDPLSQSPIKLEARDFEIESVRSLLPSELAQSIEAGKITVLAEGVLQEQSLQIPINAQLSALQIQIPKMGMQEIESLARQGVNGSR